MVTTGLITVFIRHFISNQDDERWIILEHNGCDYDNLIHIPMSRTENNYHTFTTSRAVEFERDKNPNGQSPYQYHAAQRPRSVATSFSQLLHNSIRLNEQIFFIYNLP